jgi:DNA helicase-2/ATP-dependent DNA helicase PcrA
MITEKQISPRNILCVTFTNKAAKEMKERIAKRLGIEIGEKAQFRSDYRLPYTGTFHSFAVMVLKEVL